MKQLQTLLIILTAALLFTACEKDETPEVFDSISGILSAGENVTAEELNGLPLALCQFKSDGDISNTSVNPTTFDIVEIINLDELGTFEFTNITPGNYFIAINEFVFMTDSVCRFHFDGTEALNITQIIIRNPADNSTPVYAPCFSTWAYIDIKNYSGPELTHIRAYGHIIESDEAAEEDIAFEAIDGIIKIACIGSTTLYCVNPDELKETHFVFGFADGKGGTVYSEKFEFKPGVSDGSCEGLPQAIGQTTISSTPSSYSIIANYALSNN